MTALAAAQGRDGGGRLPGLLTVSAQVTRLLQRRDLAVLDVVRGAAPGTRRLFLGAPGTETVSHVLAASCSPRETGAVDNEYLVLQHARSVIGPGLRRSLPRVIERVDVYGSSDGLAMTAVPNLGAAREVRPARPGIRPLLEALPGWLAALWSESSSSAAAPTDLGRAAVDGMLAHRDHGRTPHPALESLRRARERLADVEVRRTVTHGCLCRRHVLLSGDGPGVDDWSLGSVAGDPLRDLGRLAVSLADSRLPEVIEGKTAFAGTIRHFMGEAMGRHLEVPPQLWREVLVLSQVELALEALGRTDPHTMARLSRAVLALHAPEETR